MLDRNRALEKAREALGSVVSHERREPGWPFRHGFRTANLALWLRAGIFPQDARMDDVLYAAALFHDCAKDDENDHAEAGARRAREYLRGIVAEQSMDEITHAISMHDKRGLPCGDAEKLLQDADVIDHTGTIEIWLNVYYSALGGDGPERSLLFYDSADWGRVVSECRTSLNFELSRAVYDERIAYNEEFICRLRAESRGEVAYPEKFLPFDQPGYLR